MDPYNEGREAFNKMMDGDRGVKCEHKPYTPSYNQFWRGWSDAEDEYAEAQINANDPS